MSEEAAPEIPTRTAKSLSGTYRVKAPTAFSDADCADAVHQLEEQGVLPFRSIRRGADGRPAGPVTLAAGGGDVKLAGLDCQAIIFANLVGIIPRKRNDGEAAIEEAERIPSGVL